MAKPIKHIVSFSGGKDSTAMLLRMLEENMQVDEILFCDTGLEFPAMYKHIAAVEQYTGRKITIVKAKEDFEFFLTQKDVERKRSTRFIERYGSNHVGYGWPGPKMRWCTEKLKTQPRTRYFRELLKSYDIIEYVGLAADEEYRLSRKCNQRSNVRHPLIEWGMTESDCLAYCKERGFDWDGLYDLFSRVSCWCCPLQPLSELRMLRKHFPSLWEQLREWECMTWRNFRADYSVEQLEIRFAFEEERLAAGLPIKGKAFFDALRERLKKCETG